MKPGIYPNLPFEEYAAIKAINAGMICTAWKYNLEIAKAEMDGGISCDSDVLDFGKSFHALLLEGVKDYVIQPATYAAPKGHDLVKKGKIAEGDPLPWNNNATICELWKAGQDGKTILTEKEACAVEEMANQCREHRELSPFLNGAQNELTVISQFQGLPVKIRIDSLPKVGPVLDFKKARSARPVDFVKQAWDLGYFIRAAFYLDVLKSQGDSRNSYWFPAIEDKPPYCMSIAKYNDTVYSFIDAGRKLYKQTFGQIARAMKSGRWDGYGSYDPETIATEEIGWLATKLEAICDR